MVQNFIACYAIGATYLLDQSIHHISFCHDEQLSNQGVLPYNELMYLKATEDSDKSDHTYQQYVSDNNIHITSDSQQLLSSHMKNTGLVNVCFREQWHKMR